MRILIDTNIIIYREDHSVIESQISEFHQISSTKNINVLIHPASLTDIERDTNDERKKIIKSKIQTYQQIDTPPDCSFDADYMKIFGDVNRSNDKIDAQILYALKRDAVDFLVTEDVKLANKAKRFNLDDRVFTIPEIVNFLKKEYDSKEAPLPIEINNVPVHNLDENDEFFIDLRKDYMGFDKWFTKIKREGRKALVYQDENKKIKAILILKEENESIHCDPPQLKKQRLKICTLKVTHRGYKIGELFLKTTFTEAITKNIDEIYLTHFNEENDFLVRLITDFGFVDSGKLEKENIYIKKLIPPGENYSKEEILQNYYPSFFDSEEVGKFVVPIQPKFHTRLFPDSELNQGLLFPTHSISFTEGNTIKKAYICHSSIKKIQKYDIVFFYRSQDNKSITSFGIVENIFNGLTDPDEILKIVAKRTVYSLAEISKMTENKPVTVLIFRLYFHFDEPINLRTLMRHNILLAAPQSIMQISHEKYIKLKEIGKINERFTIN